MRKIVFSKKKILTEKDLFEKKEKFHKDLAKLPFEEKVKILTRLQEIAKKIKRFR